MSSRPTLLGILGSYVGPHICSSGQSRLHRRCSASRTEVTAGAVALAEPISKACMRGRQNRRSPVVLRSAHKPRGFGDGLLASKYSESKLTLPGQASTVRLCREQTAPAIARAARARAWRRVSTVGGKFSEKARLQEARGSRYTRYRNKHIRWECAVNW